jgi:hypothetical protein
MTLLTCFKTLSFSTVLNVPQPAVYQKASVKHIDIYLLETLSYSPYVEIITKHIFFVVYKSAHCTLRGHYFYLKLNIPYLSTYDTLPQWHLMAKMAQIAWGSKFVISTLANWLYSNWCVNWNICCIGFKEYTIHPPSLIPM